MHTKRGILRSAFVLVAVLFALSAADASAACVTCSLANCFNRNGESVLAVMCTDWEVESGSGVTNCKNVGGCGGCMGWSCSRDGEVPMSELVPEKTTIEVVAERDAPQN